MGTEEVCVSNEVLIYGVIAAGKASLRLKLSARDRILDTMLCRCGKRGVKV